MARYSASADEREMVGCFFDLQETNESPRKMQNPVTDQRESKHFPQSASQKLSALNSNLQKKIHLSLDFVSNI